MILECKKLYAYYLCIARRVVFVYIIRKKIKGILVKLIMYLEIEISTT